MIVELRRYTLQPGCLAAYLETYGAEGYPLQTRHLGPALGWFVGDVGTQNQVIHLWSYPNMADMERRRASMAADPSWIAVRDRFTGLFRKQETQILTEVEGLPYTRSGVAPGLVEIRNYGVAHGRTEDLISYLRTRAAAVQARHWPDNLAYLVAQHGNLNHVVHIWGHADHAERLNRRKALLADPEWQECLRTLLPMFEEMTTCTATPAPFWHRSTALK